MKEMNGDGNMSSNILLTKEQPEFYEKVISDWRKIRRSKKWFSIRHLARRNDSDDDNISSTFEKTSEKIELRISLSLNTEEKLLKKSEASDLYPSDTSEDDWNKDKRSIRTFSIKFSRDKKAEGQWDSKNSFEHVIELSIVEPEEKGEFDDEQRKLGEELAEENRDDVTAFVIKLVEETASKMMIKIYNKTPSGYQGLQKSFTFPRGPYMIPRVVILGPPGSGKSLQASLLAKRLKLINLEMDEILLRENQRTNTIPKTLMDSTFRDSDLMTKILIPVLKKRLLEEDCLEHGWVLTGFPLTASQALALDNLETSPNRFVYLEKSLDVCRDVLLTRVYNKESGQPLLATYNDEDAALYESNIEDYLDNDTGLITVLDNKFLMESKGTIENTNLIHSIVRSAVPELTILKAHGKYVKAIDHSIAQHEAAKSMLLHYYGGWCKKIYTDKLHPKRVHEAVVSVVKGPFPSFEEAPIYDRTAQKISMPTLSSEIESELRLRLNEFLFKEIPDVSDENI